MDQQTNFLFNKGSINCDADSSLIKTMIFEDSNLKANTKGVFKNGNIDYVSSDISSEDNHVISRAVN